MRTAFQLLSLSALVACGGTKDSGSDASSGEEWCADYLAALDGCYSELGFSLADYGIEESTYCDSFAGATSTTTRDVLACYVEVIEAADCSTEDGVSAMSATAIECAG